MVGDKKVVAALQGLLKAELTAIHQYTAQSRLFLNDGYRRLGEAEFRRAYDEMRHAKALMARLVLLGAAPAVSEVDRVGVVAEPAPAIASDTELEGDAIDLYNQAIGVCTAAGDSDTRRLLEHNLGDEVRHLRKLEAYATQIAGMGLANFLGTIA